MGKKKRNFPPFSKASASSCRKAQGTPGSLEGAEQRGISGFSLGSLDASCRCKTNMLVRARACGGAIQRATASAASFATLLPIGKASAVQASSIREHSQLACRLGPGRRLPAVSRATIVRGLGRSGSHTHSAVSLRHASSGPAEWMSKVLPMVRKAFSWDMSVDRERVWFSFRNEGAQELLASFRTAADSDFGGLSHCKLEVRHACFCAGVRVP